MIVRGTMLTGSLVCTPPCSASLKWVREATLTNGQRPLLVAARCHALSFQRTIERHWQGLATASCLVRCVCHGLRLFECLWRSSSASTFGGGSAHGMRGRCVAVRTPDEEPGLSLMILTCCLPQAAVQSSSAPKRSGSPEGSGVLPRDEFSAFVATLPVRCSSHDGSRLFLLASQHSDPRTEVQGLTLSGTDGHTC